MPADNTSSCPLCDGANTTLIHDQQDSAYFPRRIHKCTDCGFAFVYPLPSEETLGEVYNDANYFHDPDKVYTEQPLRPGVVSRGASRAQWLSNNGLSGHLLDVGCSEGGFIEQAQQQQFQCSGVELSHYAADIARRRTAAQIHTETLSELIKQGLRFDVLTLWDVLEHVTDPLAFLSECRRLIRPGGWIALSTPNQKSYNGIVKGDNWKGYRDGPEHLYFYNASTLSRMLAKAGFTTLSTRSKKIAPVLMRWATLIGWGGDLEIIGQRSE